MGALSDARAGLLKRQRSFWLALYRLGDRLSRFARSRHAATFQRGSGR